jgi:hypothetical protein
MGLLNFAVACVTIAVELATATRPYAYGRAQTLCVAPSAMLTATI